MAVLAVGALGAAAGFGAASATATGTLLGLSAATWAGIGWSVGIYLGGQLFGPGMDEQHVTREGPRIGDTAFKGGSYGQPIARVWGQDRVAGGVIWKVTPNREETVTTVIEQEGGGGKGGKGGGGGGSTTIRSYEYYATFAVQLCEGEADIRRVWANSKLIRDPANGRLDLDANMTVYRGTADQLPDPTIEAYEGVGNVPGFQNCCYVVFDDIPLKDFNNQIPLLEFEVISQEQAPAALLETIDYQHTCPANSRLADKAFMVDGAGLWLVSDLFFHRRATLEIECCRAKMNIADAGLLEAHSDDMDTGLSAGSGADNHHTYCVGTPWLFLEHGIYDSGIPPAWTDISKVADLIGLDLRDGSVTPHFLLPVASSGTDEMASPDFNSPYYYSGNKSGNDIVMFRFPEPFDTGTVAYHKPDLPSGWGAWALRRVAVDSVSGTIYVILQAGSNWYVAKYTWGGDFGTAHLIPNCTDGNNALVSNRLLFCRTATGIQTGFTTYLLSSDGEPTKTPPGDQLGPVASGGDFAAPYGQGQALVSSGRWLATDYLYDNNLGDIVAETCELCGMSPTQYDTSILNLTLTGFTRAQPMTGRDVISNLQKILAFDAVETGGVTRFVPQGHSSTKTGVTLLAEELGIHPHGAGKVPVATLGRSEELALPRSVTVVHKNLAQDYDVGVQKVDNTATISDNQIQIQLPAVLNANQAKGIARRFLNQSLWNQISVAWSASIAHIALEPSDIITLSLDSGDYTVRILTVGYTFPGILVFTGQVTDDSIYDVDDEVTDPVVAPPQLEPIVDSDVGYLDIPILRNAHAAYEGHYAYGWGLGTQTWPGATLYYSATAGLWLVGTYWSDDKEATYGTIGTPLPSVPQPWLWDDTHTLDVLLSEGTLSSSTDEEVQAGANHAAIGINGRWEIIGFVNVVDNGGGSYTLSRFLRARRGTEHVLGTGEAGDAFVFLDDVGIRRINLPTGFIGLPVNYRMVNRNDRLANAETETFASDGTGSMPFAPVHIQGSWDWATEILTITWTQRSRCTADEQYMGETYPDCETLVQFHVELRPAGESALLRTIVVDDASFTEYTLEAYRADSGDGAATQVPSLDVTVYQISSAVGRGYPGTGTT